MNDRSARQALVALTVLTVAVIAFDATSFLRVPIVVAFALLAPGWAMTRFLPALDSLDRFAVAPALSISVNVIVSLTLIATDRWTGTSALWGVVLITLAATLAPRALPSQQRRFEEQHQRNRQILERRRAQNHAYELVMSSDAERRRDGLAALALLLHDDGRLDEANRLNELARWPVPPVLPLQSQGPAAETDVRDAHERARSEDPETRRRGLFEVAALLDETGRDAEAQTLRALAADDELL